MNASTAPNLPVGLEGDILKSLRVPLAVIDNEFRFIWLNREMAWIYQAQPGQVTGRICYRLISPDTAGPCRGCPVAAVQKSGRRETSQKYKDFPDGGRKYGEVTAFPIHGPQGEIAATLVMVTDITNKIVVGLDVTHETLARLMPSLRGLPLKHPDSFTSNGISVTNERTRKENRSGLSQRETQVLHLLTKGHSNTRIASRLGISPHTVKSHVINIFNKLGVNDRIQAAVVATRQRIVE